MGETAPIEGTLAGRYGAPVSCGQVPAWLAALQQDSRARFETMGLPTTKLESWKYTNLRALDKLDFASPEAAEESPGGTRVPSLLSDDWHSHRLVLTDGRVRPELARLGALPDGVTLSSLADLVVRRPELLESHLGRIATGEDQALLALNTGLMEDGYVLHVASGVTVDHPIEVLFLRGTSGRVRASHPRCLILMEPGATATVIEHHVDHGAGAYLSNLASEVLVATNARLRHVKVQQESGEAFHLATSHVRLGQEATFDGFTLTLGGRLSRSETKVRLEGEGAHCRLSGAYLVSGKQHCDTTTVIDHLVPHTSCREVFKGVLDGEARAVFQGLIKVHRGAQQSDGHQLSKALLLSDRAEIDAKPELEIYADDVKCSHGATAGELDQDALFYLRSRGLPEARARRLLIESFLVEALYEISQERLRGRLRNEIVRWLEAQGKTGGDHE